MKLDILDAEWKTQNVEDRAWIVGPPPSRRALGEWTLASLYRLIFSGTLKPGDSMSELDLSSRLGVSRSPVREALRQLEEDGLAVTTESGRRELVRFGISDIGELYTIRAALERLACGLAAKSMADQGIDQLRDALGKMRLAIDDPPRHFEADFKFHELIVAWSGLGRLQGILARLWLQTRELLRQLSVAEVYPDETELKNVQDDHAAIVDALASRNPKRAERAMQTHLLSRRDRLLTAVREVREDSLNPPKFVLSRVGGKE